MEVRPTALDRVIEIQPRRFGDDRGWFSESWNAKTLATSGIELDWVQDNESMSDQVGTIRGIHFQIAPFAQDKLVRVLSGRIFDVAVDLRRSSPTFRHWVGVELSAEAGNQLLVPIGFGHAFCTLSPACHVAYKVSAHYAPETERSILWNDETLAIEWPTVEEGIALSAKDEQAPTLETAFDDLFD